jgi:hypothetical protein
MARVSSSASRVHDDRFAKLLRQRELRRERSTLLEARHVVVMVVEPALTDRHGTEGAFPRDPLGVAQRIEARGVMRMHAGGEEHPSRIRRTDRSRPRRGVERFSDADDRADARQPGALDHRRAVVVERRVGEMRVAVDEEGRGKRERGRTAYTFCRFVAFVALAAVTAAAVAVAAPPCPSGVRGHLFSIQSSSAPAT